MILFASLINLYLSQQFNKQSKRTNDFITSRFTDSVDIKHPHPEYPRPKFARSQNSWMNLNGEWKFQIQTADSTEKGPEETIIVPFSPESHLSGVFKQLLPEGSATYTREFNLTNFYDPGNQKEKLLLNFGAIDQNSSILLNNKYVGNNTNGYIPFSFDISSYVVPGKNTITIIVQDSSELSATVTGKQRIYKGGTFYTAQSGIWQTVWLEKVPSLYIKSLSVNSVFTSNESFVDFFNFELSGNYLFDPNSSLSSHQNDLKVKIEIFSKSVSIFSTIANYNFTSKNIIRFTFPQSQVHTWSPSSPFLYNYSITLLHTNNNNNTNNNNDTDFDQDIVQGYFALRSFKKGIDSNGVPRIFLNEEPYFQLGILDQGYWSDGLMTPPTDYAMEWDIKLLKTMGFNMIREHVKIAPLRFYYHCDRLGMIVWQDMVCGFSATDQSKHRKAVVRLLRDIPCICTWTLFNQDWGKLGQDSKKALQEVKGLDYGRRLIDTYSGGMDDNLGDFQSIHWYGDNIAKFVNVNDTNGRITALTEFGGLEFNFYLDKEGHSHVDGLFPFRKSYNSEKELRNKYKDLMLNEILPLAKTKLAATVFTQLSDIEGEMNGIVAFNRKHVKFNVMEIAEINQKFKFPFE